MHDFCYVARKSVAPLKAELIEIINQVQDLVREKFTFQYTFVGSFSRNMITYDRNSNIGFDFDVNIEVNDDEENYSASEIKNTIRSALDRIAPRYGYSYCEDSTRVLTIKVIDYSHSRIVHSCDFAIVNNYGNGKQQYIRYNKDTQTYTWEEQSKGYLYLPEKIDWLKKKKLWNEFLDYYIEKKNKNMDPDKHSRAIFAESINEMCQKNGYKNDILTFCPMGEK